MTKKEEIYFYCKLVREAIDNIELETLSSHFYHFPNRSCVAAAVVLGTYLDELGYTTIHKIYKICRIPQQIHSHTWLEHDNMLVDITADQFNDHSKIGKIFDPKSNVIVTGNGSEWYKIFDADIGPEDKEIAHYRWYNANSDDTKTRMFERDYLKILNKIPRKYWPEIRKLNSKIHSNNGMDHDLI